MAMVLWISMSSLAYYTLASQACLTGLCVSCLTVLTRMAMAVWISENLWTMCTRWTAFTVRWDLVPTSAPRLPGDEEPVCNHRRHL